VAEIVLVSVVTVFLIRSFLIQPFLVSGASMEPNFTSSNYLLVDEVTYLLRDPQRGEVIVFKYPNDPSTYYIKRVIGLPGERVEVKGGSVYVFSQDGAKKIFSEENYLPSGLKTSGFVSVQLSEEEYFVLGDNRNYSYDSRSWGKLGRENIIGLARLRLLPITQAKVFDYSDISDSFKLETIK